jgi:hypothetical protein
MTVYRVTLRKGEAHRRYVGVEAPSHEAAMRAAKRKHPSFVATGADEEPERPVDIVA